MTLFSSFCLGGFECSSHRRTDGTRLDLTSATLHDHLARSDYLQLQEHGIRAVRDGVRWHLIEISPAGYDWSSFLPMLRAAAECGMQVAWDLCHYGWPDGLDIFSEEFVTRFAKFAAAAARLVREESDLAPFYCPINEISYWSWAGGETARMNPYLVGCGRRLKRQLVRATIAAINAIRDVDSRARLVTAEPLIHVASQSSEIAHISAAEHYRQAQFESIDLLGGWMEPELGGRPEYVDVLGLNYYPDNQWLLDGPTIPFGHHSYRPLAEILKEVERRYRRPLLITETGAERTARPSWLHYVGSEVRQALMEGVRIEGMCLYPVLDYPGWDNGRLCEVGLLGAADHSGQRRVCRRTAEEILAQERRIQSVLSSMSMPQEDGRIYAVAESLQ
ncbi:beta-glucosidase [Pseudaminobacter soli (ex Zhang et al. 2022)]|nr:beta-glucosidase [Pseudaminobacter soli]